jgi:predicted nucleotidyltransferase
MKRTKALKKLRSFESTLRACGVTSLYLFGSITRDQAAYKSDLDLFLDYDPKSRFNVLDLVAAQRLLRRGLGIKVDLTTRNGLHPLLRKMIEAEAVRVF